MFIVLYFLRLWKGHDWKNRKRWVSLHFSKISQIKRAIQQIPLEGDGGWGWGWGGLGYRGCIPKSVITEPVKIINDEVPRSYQFRSKELKCQICYIQAVLPHIILFLNCRYRRSGTIRSVRGWSSRFTILVAIYTKGFIKRWFLVRYPSSYRGFNKYTGTTANLVDLIGRKVP